MVNCVKCGTLLTEGARFCNMCGAAAPAIEKIKCPKCGIEATAGSYFCNQCGTRLTDPVSRPQSVPQPQSPAAPQPTAVPPIAARPAMPPLAPAMNARPVMPPVAPATITRQLRITRESQFQCMANSYQVTVNRNLLGNISVGQTICINIPTETAVVDIICTTVMINARMRLVLRLGNTPIVTFRVEWPGDIYPVVYDAQIMQQAKYF